MNCLISQRFINMHAEPSSNPRPVLAITADLLFAARVRSTAAAVGTDIILARNADELMRFAHERAPRQIIIDLDSRKVDVIQLITDLKRDAALTSIPILAYVSHVREDMISAARTAGAERVIARGSFVKQLPALLAE
jgi:PleD family two-component response regulator